MKVHNSTMGKTSSKSEVAHNADPQIRIFNQQQQHGEQLEQHTTLIYIILICVVVQLGLTLYALLRKREQRRAVKRVKSLAALSEV